MRRVTPADLTAIMRLAAATGLFSQEELGTFRGMAAPVLASELGADQRMWVVDGADGVDAAAFAGLEAMSGGVWNLYFIGVRPGAQGRGAGSALIKAIEEHLAAEGARLLIVETLGTPEFAPQRAFYARNGFEREAVIRDYYSDGADKVTFRKRL